MSERRPPQPATEGSAKAAPSKPAPAKSPKADPAKTDQVKAEAVKAPPEPPRTPRLQQFYRDVVVKQLMQELSLKNPMQVPRIEKITVNMGVGEAVADKKLIENAAGDLTKLTGQKPVLCKSKKSIAAFKLRAGLPIGAKVTLRGVRMYDFLDRLISIAIPRIRDFRGVSARAFDGHGNYNFGVKEQIIFPEIQYDQVDKVRGMDITITTTAVDDKAGRALLSAFNFPFRR